MKVAIINAGIGHWYPKGTIRLAESIQASDFEGTLIAYKGLQHGWPTHEQNPYAFKVMAMKKHIPDFDIVIWMDSSIYCIKDANSIVRKIQEQGYYFTKNGYNLAQSVNDNCLKWFGMTRDEAETHKEIASGFWGLDMRRPESKEIFDKWEAAMHAGCFKGSRTYNAAESSDPRFQFHRQDQSALSLAIAGKNLQLDDLENILTYKFKKEEQQPQNSYVCHGM